MKTYSLNIILLEKTKKTKESSTKCMWRFSQITHSFKKHVLLVNYVLKVRKSSTAAHLLKNLDATIEFLLILLLDRLGDYNVYYY